MKMKKKLALILTLSILALSGCSDSGDSQGGAQNEQSSEQESSQPDNNENTQLSDYSLSQLDSPKAGDTIATISTTKGDIKVWFFPQYAPKAVENFTTHAKNGYYNGVIFHRVINNFMIQGGDPEGTGRGGESIWGGVFENEVVPNLAHFRGALCMANAGADTNGSQFYIVQNPDIGDKAKQAFTETLNKFSGSDEEVKMFTKYLNEYINNGGYPSLDGSYTVFGQVYEGMDVVDSIAAVETNKDDKPLEDIKINSITVGTY